MHPSKEHTQTRIRFKRFISKYRGEPNGHETGMVKRQNATLIQKIRTKETSLRMGKCESMLAKTVSKKANSAATAMPPKVSAAPTRKGRRSDLIRRPKDS